MSDSGPVVHLGKAFHAVKRAHLGDVDLAILDEEGIGDNSDDLEMAMQTTCSVLRAMIVALDPSADPGDATDAD